jgi:methyltransferase, FkbM family
MFAHTVPGLQTFPLEIPNLGVIEVDFRDASAFVWQNYLLGKKCQEHGLLLAMSRYCEPNGVLWDIGANIGLISAYFGGHNFSLRSIHAFEPNPRIYPRIKSLFRNHPIVQTHNIALSSENEHKQLYVPSGESCMGSLEQQFTHNKPTNFTVECHTGDDLLAQRIAPPPTLIKIDVEGHEMDVLEGMKKLLEKYRPVIFLEHIFLKESKLLHFEKYYIMTVSDNDGALHSGIMPEYGHNIVLIPEESSCQN